MANGDVELVLDARATLGEGPVWDARAGVVWFTDILARQVHRFDPETGDAKVIPVDQEVGTIAPRASGGLVAGVRDGFAALDDSGALTMLAPVEADDPSRRMNDGKCDRAGRLWASVMAFDGTPGAGTLYTLDPDLSVRAQVPGLAIGNGMAWTADDATMYFVDSRTSRVDAFDFDLATGTVTNRRTVVTIPEDEGLPDGMCLDAEGHLWVALFGGWGVQRFAPDGTKEERVELPVPNVTCCAFGGPGLTDLYVTTAREAMSADELAAHPEAGGLFRARPGVTGTAPNAFAG